VTPQGLFIATVAACLLSGLTSPFLGIVWHLHPVWLPELVPATRETVFYGASLIVSTATLLISAIPAALAERLFGLSPVPTMAVWLAGAILLLLAGLR
jgi:hypothetical protein